MRPHDWYRVPVEEQKADSEKYPGHPMDEDSVTFWVLCRRCEATIVAADNESSIHWHKGWRVDKDCDLTVVRDVMES